MSMKLTDFCGRVLNTVNAVSYARHCTANHLLTRSWNTVSKSNNVKHSDTDEYTGWAKKTCSDNLCKLGK